MSSKRERLSKVARGRLEKKASERGKSTSEYARSLAKKATPMRQPREKGEVKTLRVLSEDHSWIRSLAKRMRCSALNAIHWMVEKVKESDVPKEG